MTTSHKSSLILDSLPQGFWRSPKSGERKSGGGGDDAPLGVSGASLKLNGSLGSFSLDTAEGRTKGGGEFESGMMIVPMDW